MATFLVIATVLLSAAPATADASKKPRSSTDSSALPQIEPLHAFATRQLRQRKIRFADDHPDEIPELHVAAGVPTTLVFAQKVGRAQLAADKRLMFDPLVNGNDLILSARVDLPSDTTLPLTVSLEDGTLLAFQLKTVPAEVDLKVDVEVSFQQNAAPDSPQALRTSNALLRAQLDECVSNSTSTNAAGLSGLAALILEKDTGAAGAAQLRTFEAHQVHALDKQSRLLVEATYIYRLLGVSFLVLTVENRDASRPWILDRPELKLTGDGSASDIQVKTFAAGIKAGLPPGEEERVVIAFDTPQQSAGQKLSVSLFEKGGGRHTKLDVAP
jgi:uncharacterized protein (TIGR02268 family)